MTGPHLDATSQPDEPAWPDDIAAHPRPIPRVLPLSHEDAEAAAEGAGIPPVMARLSIFRVMLRHPGLARPLYDMLGALLFDGALDPRLRELIIMRLGWTTRSVYEWTQHWRVATSLGVSEADLVGVRDWRSHPGFGPAERALLAATDEVVGEGRVTTRTWDDLVAHVPAGDNQTRVLLEAITAIGAWRMVSSMLESLDVPLEDGVDPWPPDGVPPEERSPGVTAH